MRFAAFASLRSIDIRKNIDIANILLTAKIVENVMGPNSVSTEHIEDIKDKHLPFGIQIDASNQI